MKILTAFFLASFLSLPTFAASVGGIHFQGKVTAVKGDWLKMSINGKSVRVKRSALEGQNWKLNKKQEFTLSSENYALVTRDYLLGRN